MSATKYLQRMLPTMTADQLDIVYVELDRDYRGERNPMVRASLRTRLEMVEARRAELARK